MCGRYALSIRAAFVRHQFEQIGFPVDDTPADDEARSTYNFAPGHFGLVYRADVPSQGAGHGHNEANDQSDHSIVPSSESTLKTTTQAHPNQSTQYTIPGSTPKISQYTQDTITDSTQATVQEDYTPPKFKLQTMKWGLIPFWTKRPPDYGSMMKTINARDDSLAENRGMWTSMKKGKRCIVVVEGFYEWLKKNDGREKIPHFVKRKDGQVMLFAGLWDCAQYQHSPDQHWTYTIITTDSNKQLKFLHDRMPVILENKWETLRLWLDPNKTEWTSELQSLLKPYDGELDCYQVSKDVGNVRNNSPNFVVPIDSSENKNNIANFFSNTKQKREESTKSDIPRAINEQNSRKTIDEDRSEDNAPMPANAESSTGKKRGPTCGSTIPSKKVPKTESKSSGLNTAEKSCGGRATRSSTSNNTAPAKSPAKARDGSQKITSFFNK